MRVKYDHIINVDRLKRQLDTPGLERINGYAVLLENEWFWFPAVEPAYAFGRAGRMSVQVGSWRIVEAATEVRFDYSLGRDVHSLYLLEGGAVSRDADNDRDLIRGFAAGVDASSSHWTRRR